MNAKEYAESIGLPNLAGFPNWMSLPWKIFISWFEWKDDLPNSKLYFTFDPPVESLCAQYFYKGHLYYDYKLKIQKGYAGKDLEVIGFVRQCELGCFLGSSFYSEKLIAPKNGIFINLIDMERFRLSPHRTIIKPGESLFCIDYSFPNQNQILSEEALYKLRELKRIKEIGKNAESTLGYLLNKYGIYENDL